MSKPHPIHCVFCRKPIASRAELAVFGKSIQPSHLACYSRRKPLGAYRLNGPQFWVWLAIFNGGFWLAHTSLIGPLDGQAFGFLAFGNFGIWLMRIISYFSIERHLP